MTAAALLLLSLAATLSVGATNSSTTTPATASATATTPATATTTVTATRSVDESLVWWQARALNTSETMTRSLVEEALQRLASVQPPTNQSRKASVGMLSLASEHGYPAEAYAVRTSDGYTVALHRLPNAGRPAVLLGHGMLGSSADFLTQGRGRALALLLHDAGFDVWLLNARGTAPSKKNETMDHQPWNSKFWDFSWHDIGVYDLPATIDFVLQSTNQSQLHYVGFCQGSTAFFVMGSEQPELMDKIKTFVGIAPVAFLRDVRSFPLRLLSVAPNKLYALLKLFGVNEFLPNSKMVSLLADVLCSENDTLSAACSNFLFLAFGTDTTMMNPSIVSAFLANAPAGASTKQLLHYGQLVDHRRQVFRQFDYGRMGNMRKYGTPKPPNYDLGRVAAPTYIYYAENDFICVPSNIEEISKQLPNIVPGGMRRVNHDKFSHLDFLLAKNARELVYDDIVDVLLRREAVPGPPPPATTSASSSKTLVTETSNAGSGPTTPSASTSPDSTAALGSSALADAAVAPALSSSLPTAAPATVQSTPLTSDVTSSQGTRGTGTSVHRGGVSRAV